MREDKLSEVSLFMQVHTLEEPETQTLSISLQMPWL